MKKLIVLTLVVLLSSCGIKYTPIVSTAPTNTIDFSSDLKKEERECAYGLLWFPPFAGSDISVVSIAKKNGFKKVAIADHQADFFILFNRTCTIVYGE
jgi:hypothetical protein